MHLLISMCLLGIPCRYDGKAGQILPELDQLQKLCTLIPICPEQLGGLPTPRLPSERVGTHVVAKDGTDVTTQYQTGAAQALALAKRFGCRGAILKRKSPSCGSGEIYDGTFSRQLIPGWGVTAELLRQNGLLVCDETQADWLLTQLGIIP